MSIYIALLRGINVGGHNKLPMKDLAAMFEAAGCNDVRTYIQSGNVVFAATKARAGGVPDAITTSISAQFDYRIPLILRTAEQFAGVVSANPFAAEGVDERELYVGFLADEPDAEAIARLDPLRSPPGEFAVHGSEIYLRFPRGVAGSKLTNAYFDAKLKTISTMRNWRTTKKLLELATG